ncbi:hypothetical protein [Streptomyces sp. NPDC020141]|uniref:hypothetical protein n=1 Tax=Streptomyces sp. NPDC020141 TaxID=3365065 RepID=UPI00379BBF09
MSNSRETLIRVCGVEQVVRTELSGSVKKLEVAHTKAVKAALVELRKMSANVLRAKAKRLGEEGRGEYSTLASRWERGVFPRYGTYDVQAAMKPYPKVRFTDEVPDYLVELAPGVYATYDATSTLGAAEAA